MFDAREICYNCNRPKSSCVCKYIQPLNTNTKFIILMHPKEHRKTKNTTGQITHKSLINSEIFVGIDFSNNQTLNSIINNQNNECFLLYPSSNSINLSEQKLQTNKNIVIFIIDSTWACSKKILRVNNFLHTMKTISFKHNLSSQFFIKTQPNEHCLSTIESTLCLIEQLNMQNIESLPKQKLENFLNPFKQMVKYQISCANNSRSIRYKETFST